MKIIGSSWIMDHWLGKLCLLPCFTLMVSFCAIVPCFHHLVKRGTTMGPSQRLLGRCYILYMCGGGCVRFDDCV